MKKNIFFLTLVIFLVIIGGCSKKNDLSSELVEKVKLIEENDFKFRKYELTYNDYKRETSNIFSNNCQYLDRIFNYMYKKPMTNENPNPNDISVEDMNNYRKGYNKFYMEYFGLIPAEENVIVKISDVYDVDYKDWKAIFTMTIKSDKVGKYKGDIDEKYLIKRYTFEKIDDEWKVINVDTFEEQVRTEERLRELGVTRESVLSKIKYYNSFRGKAVQYPIVIEYTNRIEMKSDF